MVKPDVEIFEALLKDAGVKPEQCLFLDDGAKISIQLPVLVYKLIWLEKRKISTFY